MHACLFDMLHDPRHMHCFAIRQGINIAFDGARQVAVKQHRAVARHHHRLADIPLELGHIAHDFHGTPAQHIRGADDQRKADFIGNRQRLRIAGGNAVMGLFQAQTMNQLLETLAVFGQIDRIGRGAQNWNALFIKRIGQFQRGLAAKLHNHPVQRAVLLLDPQNFHDMFKCQRLEIQAV